jgi:acyl phosphate:glycerol-3-phosphate acyltransferase
VLLALVAAYLVGAIPVGFLVARAFGISDIRRRGSGTIGATNVLRTLGRVPAVLTLVGDMVKGYAAVAAGVAIAGGDRRVAAAGAFLAVVGNCWSVFLGFRGGKGMATGLGAFGNLMLLAVLPALLVWVAVAATFRYASLASLTAVVMVPLGGLALGYGVPAAAASAGVAALIVVRHRENISRLLAGTEHRLGERAA